MSRFIRLADRRGGAADALLQVRYDLMLDHRGPDDPDVRALRTEIVRQNLDPRDQMRMPQSDEPWTDEVNPMAIGRMKTRYIQDISGRLRAAGRRTTPSDWDLFNTLSGTLRGDRTELASQAYDRLEHLISDVEARGLTDRE